jgi:hypothetical protein
MLRESEHRLGRRMNETYRKETQKKNQKLLEIRIGSSLQSENGEEPEEPWEGSRLGFFCDIPSL